MKNSLKMMLIVSLLLAACSNPPGNNQKEKPETKDTVVSNVNPEKNKTMKGFAINIEKNTLENNNFRMVLYTAKHMQLVLMSLKPGEEIGEETHADVDQFFRFESGEGNCVINGVVNKVAAGDVIIVPAGAKHNVINTGTQKDLKLYTIYAGPNHRDGVVRATKKEAEEKEEKFDGLTTE